jgi:hypothetical protein
MYQRFHNLRELEQSSALAARTNKVDSNDRALLKFNIFTANTLRMFIENIFLYKPTLNLYHGQQWTMAKLRIFAARNRRSEPPAT